MPWSSEIFPGNLSSSDILALKRIYTRIANTSDEDKFPGNRSGLQGIELRYIL